VSEYFTDGEEVIIKGTISRSNERSKGDLYGSDEKPSKSFDVRDHIATETIAKETVVQSVISQAQSMGLSGCIAMGSGVYFQADAVADNFIEARETAKPLVQELLDTGTIVPPSGSKYEGVTIPTTTSFFGVAVGEERKRQQAYNALTPQQKALQDDFKKSVSSPTPGVDPTGSKI
jgi:hypothetical protein